MRCSGAPSCLAPQDDPVACLWRSESLWGRGYQNSRRDQLRGKSSLDWSLGRGLSKGLGLDLDEVALHAVEGNWVQQVLGYQSGGLNTRLLGKNQEFHLLHLDDLVM